MLRNLQDVFIDDGLPVKQAIHRYAKRRSVFLESCTHLTVISGVFIPSNFHNPWLFSDTLLYQDPTILYFTGLNQENIALLFDPFSRTTTLFLPPKNDHKVFWEGRFLGFDTYDKEDLSALLQVDTVCCYEALMPHLHDQLQVHNSNDLSTFWYSPGKGKPALKEFHSMFKNAISTHFNSIGYPLQLLNCFNSLTMRVILDDVDQRNAEFANQIVSTIFKRCCKHLHLCKTENDMAGFIKGELYKETWLGPSFPAIVASGENATMLHYKNNNRPLSSNGLLLLDFGCRYYNVASDISRTIPINGRYNPLQKLLYSIVLDTQLYVESIVKEGVRINELNEACWVFLEKNLQRLFFSCGGKAERCYEKQPHNVSHLIAHMVHDGDPFRHYRSLPLKSGMIISNEPGLYGFFSITIDGIEYKEHIGIRIEDNLLVTPTGCKNLTASCPKTLCNIETLLN